jgi:hypothetical protein
VKRPPEKISYSNFIPFCSYFGCMSQRLFITTERKHCLILYMRCKVCSPMYNLLYQFSQFPVSMAHLKLRKKKKRQLLSMDHHTAPCMDQWANRGTMHSVPDCQYCTKFSICYLNANDSRPVFRSSFIIMCN